MNWDSIYDVKFQFTDGEHFSKICQTIITFDIETSNGFRQPDGHVIGFDHVKYNKIIDGKDNPLYDEAYRNAIDNGTPVSLTYVWQCAIDNGGDDIKVVFGRTMQDFEKFIEMLTTEIRRQSVYDDIAIDRETENYVAMNSKHNVSMKIYIHNLGFEFQHLRNIYEKKFAGKGRGRKASQGNVFARTKRKPMKAKITVNKVSIQFTDTLVLTQKSLKNWCKDESLPVQKLEEPEDYYLEIRTPNTPLTENEIDYSTNDVVSMVYGIRKYRDKYNTLGNIPLTQTGEVRRTCKVKIAKENPDWAKQCYDITINYTPDEFKRLVNMFQGGWTHGNKIFIGKTLKNVRCFDFASSYPAVMCTRTFPLTKFEQVDVSEFKDLESQDINHGKYRWYMKIKVNEIYSKLNNSLWSVSKFAYNEDNPVTGQVVDNGRIYHAKSLTAYMTDLDWDTFKKSYDILGGYEVMELYKSEAGYLPLEMIETILDYFNYKTSLKGLKDSVSLYNESKQWVNSVYGVMVTRVISLIINFTDGGWDSKEPDDEEFINMLNSTDKENSFTCYQLGIWVTAWARHNLWDFIIPLDERLAYGDTDSIKGIFTDEDIKFVEEYNKQIEELENHVAKTLGFDPERFTALTSKGKVKRLGIMEREDDCEEFKTLGAKRYVDKVDGHIECTIAGLPKRAGVEKIKSVDEFTDGMFWNTLESHKQMAHYNDKQPHCIWTDRDGNEYESDDKYGICIQPTTFDLSLSDEFSHFLQLLQMGALDRDDEFYNDTPAWFFK